jgi:transposase, IS30 family
VLLMTKYNRMTLEERETIYLSLKLKQTQTSIAHLLGRHKSSVSRELKRCKNDSLGYLPDRAQGDACRFARRNVSLFRSAKLGSYVIEKLKLGLSPEQIAGRLKLENSAMRVSHETIYKFIYSDEGGKQKLSTLLTRQKPRRTKWYSKKPKKSHIPDSASIKARPISIEKRKTKGHFEGDLVIFRALKSANVTTLVERKSRFVKLIYNTSKYTDEVIGGIKNTLCTLPKSHCKSITFDRGTEFASYRDLGLTTFFCNPHSPWQKGSNENFNGRFRRYLPKSFDPTKLSQELLDNIANIMNNQPRKCLGFKTPNEVFYGKSIRRVALDP